MKKMRLIVTDKCYRSCEGCCNKDFYIPNIPVVSHWNYDEIYITGGEPLLFPDDLHDLVETIVLMQNWQGIPPAKIYLYSAVPSRYYPLSQTRTFADRYIRHLQNVFDDFDGFTFTLHDQGAATFFMEELQSVATWSLYNNLSLRLNVFEGIKLEGVLPEWQIKENIKWIKDCPLPEGEELRRLGNFIKN